MEARVTLRNPAPHKQVRADPSRETVSLARSLGTVLVGRAEAAVALFEAHHHGPTCAPRWREVVRQRVGASPAERLTPDRICASAWWVKNGRLEQHAPPTT